MCIVRALRKIYFLNKVSFIGPMFLKCLHLWTEDDKLYLLFI